MAPIEPVGMSLAILSNISDNAIRFSRYCIEKSSVSWSICPPFLKGMKTTLLSIEVSSLYFLAGVLSALQAGNH